MTPAPFAAFWLIAGKWRNGTGGNRPGKARLEFEAQWAMGADADRIIAGAKAYTALALPEIEPQFQPSATTWLREEGWEEISSQGIAYADVVIREYRKLTHEEQRAWETAFQPVPRQAPADCEFFGPRLQVVG